MERGKRNRCEGKRGFPLGRFVETPRKEFVCEVCAGVLRNPKECENCGSLFCRTCCEDTCFFHPSSLLFLGPTNTTTCTHCGLRSVMREPSRLLRRLITDLPVKCKHFLVGCECIRSLADIKLHEKVCEFKVVKCGNRMCGKGGRKVKFYPVVVGRRIVFVCSQVCVKTVEMQGRLANGELETAVAEFHSLSTLYPA